MIYVLCEEQIQQKSQGQVPSPIHVNRGEKGWVPIDLHILCCDPSALVKLRSFYYLTHRYSESTSSNPGNLTSATVCGNRTDCAPAAKRLANVAPEVDLGECTLHLSPQKVNKAEPTLALNPRGDVTRNPKQWPQKRTCVSAKNFKKNPFIKWITKFFFSINRYNKIGLLIVCTFVSGITTIIDDFHIERIRSTLACRPRF